MLSTLAFTTATATTALATFTAAAASFLALFTGYGRLLRFQCRLVSLCRTRLALLLLRTLGTGLLLFFALGTWSFVAVAALLLAAFATLTALAALLFAALAAFATLTAFTTLLLTSAFGWCCRLGGFAFTTQ